MVLSQTRGVIIGSCACPLAPPVHGASKVQRVCKRGAQLQHAFGCPCLFQALLLCVDCEPFPISGAPDCSKSGEAQVARPGLAVTHEQSGCHAEKGSGSICDRDEYAKIVSSGPGFLNTPRRSARPAKKEQRGGLTHRSSRVSIAQHVTVAFGRHWHKTCRFPAVDFSITSHLVPWSICADLVHT